MLGSLTYNIRKALISLVAILVTRSRSWAHEGHKIVAKIASRYLRDSGRYYVASVLQTSFDNLDKAMMEVSGWADGVDWSEELHFSHTPYQDCQPFDFKRDCGFDASGNCIVSAIANYTSRAADITLTSSERAEAIQFLVHFFADIHNPQHVGFARDFGGNAIELDSPTASLHEVWDSNLIQERKRRLPSAVGMDLSEIDPWALSEKLLDELNNADPNEYILGTVRSDISSYSAALAVAAGIASEISTQYTCSKAYTNETGLYILPGDSLTPHYLLDRSDVAAELLKRAGVRLAEHINLVGSLYSFKTRQVQWEAAALPPPPSRSILEENRFFTLSIDFYPEELLFDETVPQLVSDDESEVSEPNEIAARPQRTTPAPAVAPTLSPEEKRRLKNRKKAERKKIKKREFEGVELDRLVLVRRRAELIITYADLTKDHAYFPVTFDMYKVLFTGNADQRPIHFMFDAAAFGRKMPSGELIARALYKIRKLPFTETVIGNDNESTAEPSFERIGREMAPFGNQLCGKNRVVIGSGTEEELRRKALENFGWTDISDDEQDEDACKAARRKEVRKARKMRSKENKLIRMQYGGDLPSKEQIWNDKFRGNFDHICAYQFEHVIFYVHEDTLKPNGPIKAHQFKAFDPTVSRDYVIHLIIDTNIYAGELTTEINEMIPLVNSRNKKLISKMEKRRPTLFLELEDLNTIFFDDDPDRMSKINVIRKFDAKPGDKEESFFVFEWEID